MEEHCKEIYPHWSSCFRRARSGTWVKVYPPRFCCLARRKNGENIRGAEPRIELTSWRQREVLWVSLPGSLVLRPACALESPGEFEKNDAWFCAQRFWPNWSGVWPGHGDFLKPTQRTLTFSKDWETIGLEDDWFPSFSVFFAARAVCL